jgi:hypothetical protein
MATGKLYGLVFTALWNKEIDYDTDSIKLAATTSTYTPDQDAHNYFNDITNEITGTGYTAGGQALTTKTVTYTAATNKHVLDADDVAWITSTLTARHFVLYDATPGSDATRPLIGYQSEASDVSTTAGTLSVVWSASGIVEITAS